MLFCLHSSNDSSPFPSQTLMKCKETVCEELQLSFDKVELSMGMSNDYEQAVSIGLFFETVFLEILTSHKSLMNFLG